MFWCLNEDDLVIPSFCQFQFLCKKKENLPHQEKSDWCIFTVLIDFIVLLLQKGNNNLDHVREIRDPSVLPVVVHDLETENPCVFISSYQAGWENAKDGGQKKITMKCSQESSRSIS